MNTLQELIYITQVKYIVPKDEISLDILSSLASTTISYIYGITITDSSDSIPEDSSYCYQVFGMQKNLNDTNCILCGMCTQAEGIKDENDYINAIYSNPYFFIYDIELNTSNNYILKGINAYRLRYLPDCTLKTTITDRYIGIYLGDAVLFGYEGDSPGVSNYVLPPRNTFLESEHINSIDEEFIGKLKCIPSIRYSVYFKP